MPRNFARHEQFLRIFALLELRSAAHQPLEDQAAIAAIRERLGLTRPSPRTLRRDCEFLTSCGYAVDHVPLPDGRKYGWMLAKDGANGRRIPAEPLTLLELVAFIVGRDLLKPFEGTILWTGIESLRHKIERDIPAGMRALLAFAADGQPAMQPVLIDIERIRKVTPLDTTFTPRDVRLEDVIG